MKLTFDELLDAKHNARLRREDKQLARLERIDQQVAPLIGELCREWHTVYYVFPAGGRYFESTSWVECSNYLVRNKYVRG